MTALIKKLKTGAGDIFDSDLRVRYRYNAVVFTPDDEGGIFYGIKFLPQRAY